VVLLPFIEERRLLDAVAPLEATLTPEEAARNGRRVDQLFVSTAHPLAPEAFELAEKSAGRPPERLHEITAPLDPVVSP
jgi:5'-3' exoribonuclease 2